MEFSFIFLFFSLLFFNHAHAACIPRNSATSPPNPHAPPNLRPVSPNSMDPLAPPPAPSLSAEKSSALVDAVMNALPQASGTENPEITKVCDATDYPDVCLSVLGRFNGPSDLPSVLGIAIQAGMDFARAAVATADKLSSQTGVPPDQSSLYTDCKDSYDDAQYNFQNAHDALTGKDVGTMNTMLSAAITDVGDCQDSLDGVPDSPLAQFSDKLRKMASNCLAMITHMQKPA